MNCPLLTQGMFAGGVNTEFGWIDCACMDKNCAWWDAEWKACSILVIAQGTSRRENQECLA